MIVEQLNFIVMKRNTLFSFFLVLFLIFSCEKDNEIISDPQYSIWEENKFEDYDFTLQISCFCIIEYTMPKRIEVRDNKWLVTSNPTQGSALYKAGMSKGDLIISLGSSLTDGKKKTSDLLKMFSPGQTVKLK